MYRYIALLWSESNPQATQTVQSLRQFLVETGSPWRLAVDDQGLVILDTPGRVVGLHVHKLPRSGGAIVGKLFNRDNLESENLQNVTIGDSESQKIKDSKGHHLIDQYWGQYVAFIRDQDKQYFYVLRDPTAGLSCFWIRHLGVDIFFSSVEEIAKLGLFKFSINWSYIARHLSNPSLRVADTGLNEVTEVLAGQAVRTGAIGKSAEFYWDPRIAARSQQLENPGEAAEHLRRTVQGCVAAWASCYRTIVLELSGGLDSAILLSCLKRMPKQPDITCLNFYTSDRKGDEREFARIAATDAKCELIEQALEPTEFNIRDVLQAPRFTKPTTFTLVFASPYPKTYDRLGLQVGADGFFTGVGGDHLFHRRRSSLVAADFAYRRAFHARLLKVAYDTSRLSNESIWSVLKCALKYGLLKRPYHPYSNAHHGSTFLSRETLEMLDAQNSLHPWLNEANGIPPGKIPMIESLLELQRQFWVMPRSRNADVIYPLVSQPLIELCLAIPNDLLTLGGRERGLARAAFSKEVPRQVIERYTKGNNALFYSRLFAGNQAFVRDFLLGGELARQGLLDREAIEQHLGAKGLFRGEALASIMICVSAEAWARSWSDVGQRAAA